MTRKKKARPALRKNPSEAEKREKAPRMPRTMGAGYTLAQHQPPVDLQRRPGDVRRAFRGQKGRHVRELLGRANPPPGNVDGCAARILIGREPGPGRAPEEAIRHDLMAQPEIHGSSLLPPPSRLAEELRAVSTVT